jgi:hypothetical protein
MTKCLSKLCFTILPFFVESANCYIAPLIFFPPKLFLLGKYPKYPRPYFVGVNVLMCAFFKNGECVCVCERESARERERKRPSHTHNPVSPYFLVFSSHSPTLSFPPLFVALFTGGGGWEEGGSACARVCECVWASACACASVCVCAILCI